MKPKQMWHKKILKMVTISLQEESIQQQKRSLKIPSSHLKYTTIPHQSPFTAAEAARNKTWTKKQPTRTISGRLPIEENKHRIQAHERAEPRNSSTQAVLSACVLD